MHALLKKVNDKFALEYNENDKPNVYIAYFKQTIESGIINDPNDKLLNDFLNELDQELEVIGNIYETKPN